MAVAHALGGTRIAAPRPVLAGLDAGAPRLLVPGRNCWRIAPARRIAFLVDGEAYFGAFAAAAARARRSIVVLAYDVHSGVRLRRDGRPGAFPERLGDFLNALLERRPELHVHVLDWSFHALYMLEREPLPRFARAWRRHPRMHFALDAGHPVGGGHHQKVVVIDDAVAFVGGFDLALCRWDTRAHAARDARRVDPLLGAYPPFHDVQMVVDGEAAAALGALARARWRRAAGERLPETAASGDPWPPGVVPALTDVPVAIARTEPGWNGRPGVHEVEALFEDALRGARRFVYAEGAYLTSERIAAVLAERLAAPDGPEIVLVQPRACSGWLEESTLGLLRARVVERLRAADRHGRLRLYYPTVPGLERGCVNVHSKVTIVDDAFLRIGSANLTNRSMRVDTECDLAIEAGAEDGRVRAAIARFREDLLAEHLGTAPARVAGAVAAHGSLAAGVDALRGGSRTLVPLAPLVEPWVEEIVAPGPVVDPMTPPVPASLVREALFGTRAEAGPPPLARGLAVAAAVLALAGLSAWTPLGPMLGAIAGWAAPLRDGVPLAVVVLAVFVTGGLLLVPLTALIAVAALLFGPALGFLYALLGTAANTALAYAIGRQLSPETLRRLTRGHGRPVTRRLARRGARAASGQGIVLLTPLAVIGLAAGAARIPVRRFAERVLAPLVPGVFLLTLLAHWFIEAVRLPGAVTFGAAAGLLGALVASGAWLSRRLRRLRLAEGLDG